MVSVDVVVVVPVVEAAVPSKGIFVGSAHLGLLVVTFFVWGFIRRRCYAFFGPLLRAVASLYYILASLMFFFVGGGSCAGSFCP